MRLKNWYQKVNNGWWYLDGWHEAGHQWVHVIFLKRNLGGWWIYATSQCRSRTEHWIPLNVKDEEEAKALALLFL